MGQYRASEEQVKAANRQLYDAVADRYEEIDGRRSPPLRAWLGDKLSDLRRRVPGGRLLDIGAGSGLVASCAEGLFGLRVGCDISPRILAASRGSFDAAFAADADRLPFADNTFDAVTCFAVLHHLYAFAPLVLEVARVLVPGGVFYSDHDMDAAFYRRFRLPLWLYRKCRDAAAKYRRASAAATEELYERAECHATGIDVPHLAELLQQAGFLVEARFHWYGLSALTDRVFGSGCRSRGWAPLACIIATNGEP